MAARTSTPTPGMLAEVRYFQRLPARDLQWLATQAELCQYAPRELIIREGAPCAGLYALRSGRARIFKTSRSGRQQAFAIVQAGDTFNEVPVFDGGPNPASVDALSPAEVIAVPRDAALALIARSPDAALALLSSFATHLRSFTALIESLAFDDVTRRLARFLAHSARAEGTPTADGIAVPRTLTVQDIAAMVGSVREVVTRALGQLEGQGVIIVHPDRFVVPNIDALDAYASG